MKEKFCLGIGRAVITPKIGTFLAGYSTSGRDATSVNDDLTASVFCFEQGKTRAMIISLTVNLVDKDISDKIRKTVEKDYGVPYSNIIVHTIHTHSSPQTFTTSGWGYPNVEYVEEILLPGVFRAVKEAFGSVTAVKVAVSTGESLVGINRRQMNSDNQIVLGQDKHGYFDPKMTVISFADEDGKCVGNLVHYGCHATGAGSNLQITRDWPGVMIDRLEAESGGITAFINGTAGDVGPRLSNGRTTGCGDITYALEQGAIAAADAVRIYNGSIYRDVDLTCNMRMIKIPVEKRISYEEAKHRHETAVDNNPQHLSRIKMHFEDIMDSYGNGYVEKDFEEYEQVAIKIGDVAFISSPFETFSEIGIRINKYSDIPHVLLSSMSNGCESYFPTKGEIYRGGYEAKCFKTERVQPFVDDADYAFITESLETLRGL